eukprot:2563756-Prymnesium_polylepis.1
MRGLTGSRRTWPMASPMVRRKAVLERYVRDRRATNEGVYDRDLGRSRNSLRGGLCAGEAFPLFVFTAHPGACALPPVSCEHGSRKWGVFLSCWPYGPKSKRRECINQHQHMHGYK